MTEKRNFVSLLLKLRNATNPFDVPLDGKDIFSLIGILTERGHSISKKESLLLVFLLIKAKRRIPESLGLSLLLSFRRKDSFGTFLLGECYRIGIPPFGKSEEKAFSCLLQAYCLGFPDAASRLLSLRNLPKGLSKKIRKNRPFVRQDKTTRYCEALFLSRHGQEEQAKERLLSLLEEGYREAFIPLMSILFSGKRKTRDYSLAFSILKRLARNGKKEAFFLLGRCYLEGKGTERNIPRAILAFQKVKEDKEALFRLGLIWRWKGHRRLAKDCLQRALSFGKKEAEIPLLLVQSQDSLKSTRSQAIERLRALSGKDKKLFYPLARIYEKLGDGRSSSHFLRLALKSLDKRAVFHALKTGHLEKEGEMALESLQRLGRGEGLARRLRRLFQRERERQGKSLSSFREWKEKFRIS